MILGINFTAESHSSHRLQSPFITHMLQTTQYADGAGRPVLQIYNLQRILLRQQLPDCTNILNNPLTFNDTLIFAFPIHFEPSQ